MLDQLLKVIQFFQSDGMQDNLGLVAVVSVDSTLRTSGLFGDRINGGLAVTQLNKELRRGKKNPPPFSSLLIVFFWPQEAC